MPAAPRPPLRLLTVLVLPLLAAQLPARALADDVSVSVQPVALAGQDKPKLVVTLEKPVSSLTLELRRSDGRTIRVATKALRGGQQKVFELDQPEGTFRYEGRLRVLFPKGDPKQLPLEFDATLGRAPTLAIGDDAVDLAARRVTFAADRALSEVKLRVVSDEGQVVSERTQQLGNAPAGTAVAVTWEQAGDARVMRIDVRAIDPAGFYQDVELYPWKIEIPHEDVLFATGKAEIAATEKEKLEAAYAELAAALAKYGRYAKVQLFVAGHTDTVGDAPSNQALSEARAAAIARWFRQRGTKVPISFAGFGESGLLVQTADETDESRNRRAQYIVSVVPPAPVRWTRLK